MRSMEFELPKEIPGEIIGFTGSSNLSSFTVQVLNGKMVTEYRFAMSVQDVKPGTIEKQTKLVSTSLIENGLNNYLTKAVFREGSNTPVRQ